MAPPSSAAAGGGSFPATEMMTPRKCHPSTPQSQDRSDRYPAGEEKNGGEHDDDDEWVPVQARRKTSDADASADLSLKSKSARKNERRKERKRQERMRSGSVASASSTGQGAAAAASAATPSSIGVGGTMDEDEDLSLALAISSLDAPSLPPPQFDPYDIDGPYNPDSDPRRKRLRNLRKKLSAAESLLSRPSEELDDEQRAKAGRAEELRAEATVLEDQLASEERERTERTRRRREREEERQRQRLKEWSDLEDGRVVEGFGGGGPDGGGDPELDQDEFACPLCFGPLETPVSARPCSHVFCRACLESAVCVAARNSGGDPSSCVCPLCRACLYDPSSELVRADPAENVKRRMRKRRCKCRCGAEVALSGLRNHLRECGRGAPSLFGDDERKNFGHAAFEQPELDPIKVAKIRREQGRKGGKNGKNTKKKKGRGRSGSEGGGGGGGSVGRVQAPLSDHAVPSGYDEEAEIQAAILRSLEDP